MQPLKLKDIVRLADERKAVTVEMREVVQEWEGREQVFVRVRIANWRFIPHAQIPFVLIGKVLSHHVRVDPDLMALNAYFDRPLPAARVVTVGWGRTVDVEFPIAINPRAVERLDRKKLPKEVIDLRRGK